MVKKQIKKRIVTFVLCLACCSFGIFIILYNLENNITFFYPPSKIPNLATNHSIRIGGLVKRGSIIKYSANNIEFIVTDNIAEVVIVYNGILPALFREEQGVVAEGRFDNTKLQPKTTDKFIATELLTKHDENYMPPTTELEGVAQ